jgi:glycosyltransferase involved in cell wall biosynthesis
MTAPHRVCLVTAELFPFTAGGIGRLLHNQLIAIRDLSGVEVHLLFPDDVKVEEERARAIFGNRLRMHWASSATSREPTHREEGTYPPPAALTCTTSHGESLQLMLCLKALEEAGTRFSVIEFPDYKGWAFCSLQEKKLGQAFLDSEIAIRLHSTSEIIRHLEHRKPSQESVGRFELERKALHDADRIVAHLRPIAEFNRRFHAFEPEWLNRVHIEFPAVTSPEPRADPSPVVGARDLVFASKIQGFKRPDLFVRAVATLMRRRPTFTGRAVLSAHRPDTEGLSSFERLIPSDLRHRFVFLANSPEARQRLLASGIVVIPSDYESLCLLAYEVAAAGGTLVLNGAAAAFGDESPFSDPDNCFKFDGTVDGLVEAMGRALDRPKPGPVAWRVESPYWATSRCSSDVTLKADRLTPSLVSVLITNHNLGRYLPEAIESAVASDYPALELVIVDDASTASLDRLILEKLEQEAAKSGVPLKVVVNEVNRGLPASRNRALAMSSGAFVLPLDADDLISPTFISQAVAALQNHPEFDVVTATAGFFTEEEQLLERRFFDYATFLGDAPTLGTLANRLGCATSLMRRSVFDKFSYNEQLTSYEDWELYLRLAQAGHRFLVTNQVHFFYRRREGSMIHGVTADRHFALLAQIYDQLPQPPGGAARLSSMLALSSPTTADGIPVEDKPLRHQVLDTLHETFDRFGVGSSARLLLSYELADSLNRGVKKLPLVHGLLKRSARIPLPPGD